jgi:hypothetical protein
MTENTCLSPSVFKKFLIGPPNAETLWGTLYVDPNPVDSIHEKPTKLKKWTQFFTRAILFYDTIAIFVHIGIGKVGKLF